MWWPRAAGFIMPALFVRNPISSRFKLLLVLGFEVEYHCKNHCTPSLAYDHRRDSGACPDTRRFNTLYEIRCSTLLVSPESSCLCRLNSIEPPWYGPVCPVVWEGWRRETSPYPDHWHFSDMGCRGDHVSY
jgi:hypothetical protein